MVGRILRFLNLLQKNHEPYSSDYNECLERAADEKAENARSELVNHVENMEEYDVVFLGLSQLVVLCTDGYL